MFPEGVSGQTRWRRFCSSVSLLRHYTLWEPVSTITSVVRLLWLRRSIKVWCLHVVNPYFVLLNHSSQPLQRNMNLAPLWRYKLHALLQDMRCFFLGTFALPQHHSFPSKCCRSFLAGSTLVKKDVLCGCPSIPIKGSTKTPGLSEETSLNLVQCSMAKGWSVRKKKHL